MKHQHESHHQTLDPFAALGICAVQRAERAVQDHLAAQACTGEPRRRITTTVRAAWTWLRHRLTPTSLPEDAPVLRTAYFRDPDGNEPDLFQPIGSQSPQYQRNNHDQ